MHVDEISVKKHTQTYKRNSNIVSLEIEQSVDFLTVFGPGQARGRHPPHMLGHP